MGSIIGKLAGGLGAAVGSAFVSPIKTIFGESCEGVCAGIWDILCFIEHLCISHLVKLLMVFSLSYATLLFFYLLIKMGVVQCIGRSLCKMSWVACETYFCALKQIACFLWYKLKNTKRVYRGRRFRDIKEGTSSMEDSSGSARVMRMRELLRERRKERIRRSLYSVRHGHKGSFHHEHISPRSKWRNHEASVHLKNYGRRNPGHLRHVHTGKRGMKTTTRMGLR